MKQMQKKIEICNKRNYRLPLICILASISFWINTYGQDGTKLRINIDYKPVITTLSPVLLTNNPAKIEFCPIDSILNISTQYNNRTGDFTPVSNGHTEHNLNLETNSYKRINKTMFYGSFNYIKSKEIGTQYANTFDLNHPSPYLFVDSIGNDTYSREQFVFSGGVSHKTMDNLTLGAEINYKAASASQDRDPRTLNKINKPEIKIGAIYSFLQNHKIGIDLYYKYYNEDIDITTVKENTTHFLFGLTGLGTYSKHEAADFYRLYNRNTLGGNVQYMFKNHIVSLGYSQFSENIYDGRKENEASWSAIKHDSKFRNRTFSAEYIYTISSNERFHQFILNAKTLKNIGTEVIQSQELVDKELSVYQWNTITENDKYTLNNNRISFSYKLSKFTSAIQRDFWCGADILYFSNAEQYYNPDLHTEFKNIKTMINFGKHFNINNSGIEIAAFGGYSKNIDKNMSLPYQTFITHMLITPNYEYNCSDYWQTGLAITYNNTINEKLRLFMKMNLDAKYSNSLNEKLIQTSLSIGALF